MLSLTQKSQFLFVSNGGGRETQTHNTRTLRLIDKICLEADSVKIQSIDGSQQKAAFKSHPASECGNSKLKKFFFNIWIFK